MSRRITFTAGDSTGREKAIQPNVDDRIERLIEAVLAEEESRIGNGHPEMTVIQDSVTEEVLTDPTGSSRVYHRREKLIMLVHLPQNTAEKEAAEGDEAPGPNESDQRLVKLAFNILKRIDKLLFDSFLVELFKESGKEVARVLITEAFKVLKWILITLFFIHWVLPLITPKIR